MFEDTPEFVARHIIREVKSYLDSLSPPFFRALVEYAQDGSYSWHCPGHSGGVAFLKSPVGQMFHQFFGENMVDVLMATGNLWQTLVRSAHRESPFRVRIVSPSRRPFRCGNGVPVVPELSLPDDPAADIVILPELWLGPDEHLAGRHPMIFSNSIAVRKRPMQIQSVRLDCC